MLILAQAIINMDDIPHSAEEDLFQILAGANSVLRGGVELFGGHTNSGKEFGFELFAMAFRRKKILFKKDAEAEDLPILTKPIRAGLVFAADMRNKISPLSVDAAIQSMLQSNYDAISVKVKKYKIHAFRPGRNWIWTWVICI